MIKNAIKKCMHFLPSKKSIFYKYAKRYIDYSNGDNNSDSATNGEEKFLSNTISGFTGDEVIFDVGSNIGDWSKYCLDIKPNLNMHLFEPSYNTFRNLSIRQWSRNVHLNNIGLGERYENVKLNIAWDGSGMNSLYKRRDFLKSQLESTESINLISLDEYCEDNNIAHINLLKVDVEGHELAVLRGASKMILHHKIDLIQFEYGGCYLDARVFLKDIWDLLDGYGYKFYKIFPKELKRVRRYEQCLEKFNYSNWVARL